MAQSPRILNGFWLQVVWVELAPSNNWPKAASDLRAVTRAAAGRLLTQLYDRNFRRSFAPTEAFQARI